MKIYLVALRTISLDKSAAGTLKTNDFVAINNSESCLKKRSDYGRDFVIGFDVKIENMILPLCKRNFINKLPT